VAPFMNRTAACLLPNGTALLGQTQLPDPEMDRTFLFHMSFLQFSNA